MKRLSLLGAAAFASACTTTPRFVDAPIVWHSDDTRHVAEPPAEISYHSYPYMADVFLMRRSTRALELRDKEPAHNTNALDEVPDSTWFTQRIGRHEVSPETAAIGPDEFGPPVLPLTVKGGKEGGGNPGFVAKDARGKYYLIKFDTPENPEMQTATDAIVSRLLWLVGYNLPADHVFEFARKDVVVGEGTKIKNALLEKRPMTEQDLDELLARAPLNPKGSYRALASTYLLGKPLGGAPAEGVRADDPNDLVPHEHRRELRGLRVFAAWLNHTDMKEDNTLDMYVESEGRSFVRHYLLDVGEAFAAHAAEKGRLEDGYENFWDWQAQPLALLSLGLWKRPWEDLVETPWLAVGAFAAEPFDPEDWREAYPYWPFSEATAVDNYWGARILMRVRREHLEAVVKTGKLSHPAAEQYLVEVLLARARTIGRAYLEAVTPLDDFEIRGQQLCAVDQSVRAGLVFGGTVEIVDDEGELKSRAAVAEDGTVCLPIPDARGYHVLRVRTQRGRRTHPIMQLHLRGGTSPRLLGLVRIEDF